jgi:hypothetical protein
VLVRRRHRREKLTGAAALGVRALTEALARVGSMLDDNVDDGEAPGTGGSSGGGSNRRRASATVRRYSGKQLVVYGVNWNVAVLEEDQRGEGSRVV